MKYGLKLYSTDTHLFQEAKKLIEKGKFQFLELNIISDMQKEAYEVLDGLPMTLHVAFPKYHVISTYNGLLFENMITDTPADIIAKRNPLCFDFEKAAKAAKTQNTDYIEYIALSIKQRPGIARNLDYFHVSGCDIKSEKDEHLNLWEGNLPLDFVKQIIGKGNPSVVFETPKGDTLENDLKNLKYFKEA